MKFKADFSVDNNQDKIAFSYGNKMNLVDFQAGYILPSKLGHLSSPDVVKDLALRRKASRVFSLSNQLSAAIPILKEMPTLTADDSQPQISERVVSIAMFLSSTEETTNQILASELQEVFQHKMVIRKKISESLEPEGLRKDLSESSLLCSNLFPTSDFEKADGIIKSLDQTSVVKNAEEENEQSSTSKVTGRKRKENSPDEPTIRQDIAQIAPVCQTRQQIDLGKRKTREKNRKPSPVVAKVPGNKRRKMIKIVDCSSIQPEQFDTFIRTENRQNTELQLKDIGSEAPVIDIERFFLAPLRDFGTEARLRFSDQ